jgi:hypothetical protein
MPPPLPRNTRGGHAAADNEHGIAANVALEWIPPETARGMAALTKAAAWPPHSK